MANMDKVTVDKSYFDALLRRADFHTSTQILGQPDPANVTISRVEYDSLLRTSREFELLKTALFQGGLTPDTLALLISGVDTQPKQTPINSWADEYDDQPAYDQPKTFSNGAGNGTYNNYSWKSGPNPSNFNQASATGGFQSMNRSQPQASLRVPSSQPHGVPSSVPEDGGFDTADSLLDTNTEVGLGHKRTDSAMRTLYFCGFPPQTSYRDLLSVIKGGKILSINMRSERSATVTFLDAAADYLAWVKRNDIYLHTKRVEVRWADRQFHLNNHISNKIANGTTRNILIRNALSKGFDEARIRDDMEHIHNLVIIDVTFQNGHAYVSTNSVHNAMFARTCMMSRATYRGCKVEFYADECDVALPVRAPTTRTTSQEQPKKNVPLGNRFNMLDVNSDGTSTGEENRDPLDGADSDDDTIDIKPRHGVRLDFLDSESEI